MEIKNMIKSCKFCPFKHGEYKDNHRTWFCNIDGHYVHWHVGNNKKSRYCKLFN